MAFQQDKYNQLKRKDKSNEQDIDKSIFKLCNKINSKNKYYTTSSCSGRIVLVKALEKKAENIFLFKTHDKITLKQLKKELKKISYKDLIYFKQEPSLIVVACNNINNAKILFSKAQSSGFKRSGIILGKKRVICEMMSLEKLELPIKNKNKILLADSYLKLLVKEANNRMENSRKRINRFEKAI